MSGRLHTSLAVDCTVTSLGYCMLGRKDASRGVARHNAVMSELNGDRSAWLRCYRCWSQNLEIQIHYDAIRRVDPDTGIPAEGVDEVQESAVQCLDCMHDHPLPAVLDRHDAVVLEGQVGLVVHEVEALHGRFLDLVDAFGGDAGVGVDPADRVVVDLDLEVLGPAAVAAQPGRAVPVELAHDCIVARRRDRRYAGSRSCRPRSSATSGSRKELVAASVASAPRRSLQSIAAA